MKPHGPVPGKPHASAREGCTQQPIGKLVVSGDDTLHDKFGDQEVRLAKQPEPATSRPVPSVCTGTWGVKRDFSTGGLLQLKTLTTVPGDVLITSVEMVVPAGRQGETKRECFYRGNVFSANEERLFTTLPEATSPQGEPCPAFLPTQTYSPGRNGTVLQVTTLGNQGIDATVEHTAP
jgi:hypothetical protein